MVDETEKPMADGPDSWWKAAAGSVDVTEREKQAIAAEDFQERRVQAYLESGGQTDIGGWRGASLGSGRQIYAWRGRQIDWR